MTWQKTSTVHPLVQTLSPDLFQSNPAPIGAQAVSMRNQESLLSESPYSQVHPDRQDRAQLSCCSHGHYSTPNEEVSVICLV